MVLTLMIITRKIYGLEDIMTDDHIEKMNIIILVTGTMVGFAYLMEFFIAWYSGVEYEKAIFILRATGPYAWAYWIDRKSTRLNSSHVAISYAVFCFNTNCF